ncbi:class I SAM-dependent methyltransferase [Brassicibacter mesophilus]|uniref:class I SAM-dependent methyltransferase n=1 Tax=Brassicibacter mesophilus TaxID=745119 RepID=UPI003D1DED72
MTKERKETFNEVSKKYERIRPTYPIELFDDIVKYSDIKKGSKILEIGCGTGKATQGFVDLGYKNFTCIELGSELAKLTKEKFKEATTVKVFNMPFEEWSSDHDNFDLAIAATSFHFIDPALGYPKVANLLNKKGSIGFFWTVHVQSYNDIYSDIRKVYHKYAPQLDDSKIPLPKDAINTTKQLILSFDLFEDLTIKEYEWNETYTAEEYIALLDTHSKHRLLPEENRELLFEGITDIIHGYGGKIQKQHLVALYLARKK